MMVIICAVDRNWNIGYKGQMLCRIPGDLKYFKDLTKDNNIIMGRKTLESLPQGKALPCRTNIVLTTNKEYMGKDIICVHSLEALLTLLKKINPENKLTNFVIGGGEVVDLLLPYCNKAYITKIEKTFEKSDTLIPNLDEKINWIVDKESKQFVENGLSYRYVIYKRIEK